MKSISSHRGEEHKLDVSENSYGCDQARCESTSINKSSPRQSKYFSDIVPEEAIRSSLCSELAEEYLSFVYQCEKKKRKDDISNVSVASQNKEQHFSKGKTSSGEHKENLPAQQPQKLGSQKKETIKKGRRRKNTIRDLLKCVACSKEFPTKERKQAHYNDHLGPKGYECTFCVKAFDKMPALVSHISRIHLIDKNLACKVCGKKFRREWLLRSHSLIHTSGRKFSCPMCKMGFSHKTQLFEHISGHVGFNPYKCEECDKRFQKSSYLSFHRKIHVSVRPFKCRLCNIYCSSYSAIKMHSILHQENLGFECKDCNVRVPSHVTASHLASHIKEKNFQCNLCPAKFHAKSTLRDHLIAHSYIKEFECDICKEVLCTISDCSAHSCSKWDEGFSVEFCHHCNLYVRRGELKNHNAEEHAKKSLAKSNFFDDGDEEMCDENGDCISVSADGRGKYSDVNSKNGDHGGESDYSSNYSSDSSDDEIVEDYLLLQRSHLDLNAGLVQQIRQMEKDVEDDSDKDE